MSLSVSKPSPRRHSVSPVEAASPALPADIVCRPTQICREGKGGQDKGAGDDGRGATGVRRVRRWHRAAEFVRGKAPLQWHKHAELFPPPTPPPYPHRPSHPPTCPFMKVPVVSTAARQRKVMPK